MLLWKIKDFFHYKKWLIVTVRTFFLILELETEVDSLEKEIKYKGTGESMFCSKLQPLCLLFKFNIIVCNILWRKNHIMTKPNKRQKLLLNTSSELDGWTDGHTDGRMDGQK